jgi:hypothetical protein
MSPRRPVSAPRSLVLPALLSLAGALTVELLGPEAKAQPSPPGVRRPPRRPRGQRGHPTTSVSVPRPPERPIPTGGTPVQVHPTPTPVPPVRPPQPPPQTQPPLAIPGGLGRVTTQPRHRG